MESRTFQSPNDKLKSFYYRSSMPTNRKPLSYKIRFEVFKRDSFKCSYCGRSPSDPDIILHVDHIDPVSKGGTNDLINLITSCEQCNRGKGAIKLNDNSVVVLAKKQADEMNERRIQLDMMMKWQRGLIKHEKTEVDMACELWTELTSGYSLTKNGHQEIKKFIKEYNFKSLLQAIKIATGKYLVFDKKGIPTLESVNKAYTKIGGVLRVEKESVGKPHIKEIYYIKGILRNRMYVNESVLTPLLEEAVEKGVSTDRLKVLAKNERSWTSFKEEVYSLISKSEKRKSSSQSQAVGIQLSEGDHLIGATSSLITYLRDICNLNDDSADLIANALGKASLDFENYLQAQESVPESIYEALYNFLDLPLSINKHGIFKSVNLEALNLLLRKTDYEYPFFYFSGHGIEKLIFYTKRQFEYFFKSIEDTSIRIDDVPFLVYIQRPNTYKLEIKSVIYRLINNLINSEFKLLNIFIPSEKVMRVLKYYSYESILSILASLSEKKGEDENNVGELSSEEAPSWNKFVLELSINGTPSYDLMIRLQSAEEFMEIFRDCPYFGEALYCQQGVLYYISVYSWEEYLNWVRENSESKSIP